MRFFHIADVHLGAEPDKGCPWSQDRSREIWDSFRKVIEQAGKFHADLFLIAGDLFHRQPLAKDLKKVNALFSMIPDTKIVLIAGNHDYLRKDSPYRKFKWEKNVWGLWSQIISHVDFPDLGVRVRGCSYGSREITRPVYDSLKKSGEMPVEILLAHGGDEKHIPISKEKLAASGFDYIALGHIHKPQFLQKDRIAYAGALEPIDKNDTGTHGFIQGEIRNGKIRTAFIPWALREYQNAEIKVTEETTQYSLEQKIRDRISTMGEENIYTLTIQGKRDPETEFYLKPLYGIGNIRDIEDKSQPSYSLEELCRKYKGSLLEEYIRSFGENPDEEAQKALHYGIGALLETGEEIL